MTYKRPVIITCSELNEGIFAASGAGSIRIIPCDPAFQFRPGVWRYDLFLNLSDCPPSGVDVTLHFDKAVGFNYCDWQKGVSGIGTDTLYVHFNQEDAVKPGHVGFEVLCDTEPTHYPVATYSY